MFKNMSKREKLFLWAGALSVISFSIIKFVLVPIYDDNRNKAEQIQSKILFIQKYKEILAQKEFYNQKDKETRRIHSLLQRSFLGPSKPALAAASLQRILDDQADRSSIEIIRAKIETPKLMEGLQAIPIEVTLKSNLKDLSRFIRLIENHPKILIIEDFSTRRINNKDPELLESRLLVNGFIQKIVNSEAKGI